MKLNPEFIIKTKGKEKTRYFKLDKKGYLKLEEQTDYVIEFDEEPSESIKAQINDNIFSWINSNIGILNYHNYVGLSKFCGCNINVQSKKIAPKDFEKMLVDITESIASLPFDFNSPTYLPFDRTETVTEDVLYHNFIYLRYIMLQVEKHSRLESLIHRIIYNPHRHIYKREIDRDISFASNFNQKTIQRIFEKSECLTNLGPSHPLAATALASRLEEISYSKSKFFPVEILDQQMESTIDTNENRFIKYFLNSCLDIIALFVEKILVKENYMNAEIELDAKRMEEQISQLLTHNFFFEVGELTQMPFNSQVLQKRDGYREVFEHFAKMSLAMNFPIDSKDLRRIIDNKDIATLYEYWTFFKVAEILESLIGGSKNALTAKYDEEKTFLDYKIKLKYPNKINLYYNKSFSGNKPAAKKGSYSVTLRPDIILEIGEKLYLFDAKFKYDFFQDFFGEIEDSEGDILDKEEQEEERTKTFKKGDLYKMHTYRDAIHNVQSVWIIYPGDVFKFFSEEEGKVADIENFSGQSGVGALPMRIQDNNLTNCHSLIEKILVQE